MLEKKESAFVFPSTHYAMAAENILVKAKISIELVSLPTMLGLGCGTAIIVKNSDEKKVCFLLKENNIPIMSLYTVSQNGSLWQSRSFGDICDIF